MIQGADKGLVSRIYKELHTPVGRRISIIGRYKIDRREVKNCIGNGQAKELICMTHGHELTAEGNAGGREVQDGGGERGEKMGQL